MDSIEILPNPNERFTDSVERSCTLKGLPGIKTTDNETRLWFSLDSSVSLPDEADCDSYLLAVLMDAMKANKNIVVHGSVSKSLLSNLCEFQSAWHKWLPDEYSIVEISVEAVREVQSLPVSGAICAFSGGVDATFSVWRHYSKKFSHRSQDIKLASIVHGFDIPLYDEEGFNRAFSQSQKTLDDLGIQLFPIKTNYRKISRVNWEHAFSCALVAALGNFKKLAGTCIVGSSEPYDSLVIPWGSSPITDYLLASDDFYVIHDGASHSRTEKVREIVDWEIGMNNLRVCWEGENKDSNCGVCEKCLRTRLNFMATGSRIPVCFPESDILNDLKRVRLKNDAVRAEWQQIYDYARHENIRDKWVDKLPVIIKRKGLVFYLKKIYRQHADKLDSLFPEGSRRREWLFRFFS